MLNQLQQLWAKESLQSPSCHSCYVDLFDALKSLPVYRENVVDQPLIDVKKDNALAVESRQRGNEFSNQKDYPAAIEQYNKSLCFADRDSVKSLAFANRSHSFLKLGLFNECLIDIELALKADYPAQKRPKLEERKLVCLSRMKESIKSTTRPPEPQLSFDTDDRIGCMAKVMQIAQDSVFGRYFIAQRDVPEDRVVMIEEPLMKFVDVCSQYRRCHCCLKENTNVIPCTTCTTTLFCSKKCVAISAKFHQLECDTKFVKYFDRYDGTATRNCLKFVLRTMSMAMDNFTLTELMEYVEYFRSDSSPYDVTLIDDSLFESILGTHTSHTHIKKHND